MFERFTDRARRVIVLAQEEARTLQHNYIGTEHLLLGLIREGEGVAAKALASKGVTLDDTRKQVEEMIGKGNASPNGHIPFTPHARQVLELSLREALQLGHSYIGTEHILLGLIHEGEGVGTQVLIKMDVNLGELRSATIDLIRGNSSDGKNDGKGELANAGACPSTLVSPSTLYRFAVTFIPPARKLRYGRKGTDMLDLWQRPRRSPNERHHPAIE